MAKCQCGSKRIAEIIAVSKDRNIITLAGEFSRGYPPVGFGFVSSGDDLKFSWCLDCGRIQGEFPVPLTYLEGTEEEEGECGIYKMVGVEGEEEDIRCARCGQPLHWGHVCPVASEIPYNA